MQRGGHPVNRGGPESNAAGWRRAYEAGIGGDLCDRIALVRDRPPRLVAAIEPPPDDGPGRFFEVTPRQREVLALLGRGHSQKIVAALLGVTPWTVQSHAAAVIWKLGARNITHAAVILAESSCP